MWVQANSSWQSTLKLWGHTDAQQAAARSGIVEEQIATPVHASLKLETVTSHARAYEHSTWMDLEL